MLRDGHELWSHDMKNKVPKYDHMHKMWHKYYQIITRAHDTETGWNEKQLDTVKYISTLQLHLWTDQEAKSSPIGNYDVTGVLRQF